MKRTIYEPLRKGRIWLLRLFYLPDAWVIAELDLLKNHR